MRPAPWNYNFCFVPGNGSHQPGARAGGSNSGTKDEAINNAEEAMAMRVKDIMASEIATCSPNSDLATVAMMMWDKGCGVVPVTSVEGKRVGMIIGRDISIAGATQHRLFSNIPVTGVKDGRIISCSTEQDVKDAIKLMANATVRRLSVVDGDGRTVGILSMGDVVANIPGAGNGKSSWELPYEDVINVLKSIYVPH
jgi:CBS domain-containing protein